MIVKSLFTGAALTAALFASGCTKDSAGPTTTDGGDGSGSDQPLPTPINGFQIVSPPVTLQPHEEKTFCYYFVTTNTAEVEINQWVSKMSEGSHHLIVYFTDSASPKAGQAPSDCGQGITDRWTYSSQTPIVVQTMNMPADDGAGLPLAQKVPAGQAGYVQMHYLNNQDVAVDAHVEINANGLVAGTAFTPTAAFITYSAGFTIPGSAQGYVVSNTCAIPAGKKFWEMSTHAHKQAIDTDIVDNAVSGADGHFFHSTDWEHPEVQLWSTSAEFKTFATSFTNSCTYNNPTANPIHEGASAATNEMCMAVGYMFPADKPMFCLGQGQTSTGTVGSFP